NESAGTSDLMEAPVYARRAVGRAPEPNGPGARFRLVAVVLLPAAVGLPVAVPGERDVVLPVTGRGRGIPAVIGGRRRRAVGRTVGGLVVRFAGDGHRHLGARVHLGPGLGVLADHLAGLLVPAVLLLEGRGQAGPLELGLGLALRHAAQVGDLHLARPGGDHQRDLAPGRRLLALTGGGGGHDARLVLVGRRGGDVADLEAGVAQRLLGGLLGLADDRGDLLGLRAGGDVQGDRVVRADLGPGLRVGPGGLALVVVGAGLGIDLDLAVVQALPPQGAPGVGLARPRRPRDGDRVRVTAPAVEQQPAADGARRDRRQGQHHPQRRLALPLAGLEVVVAVPV